MKEFVMNKTAPIVQTPKGKLRGFRYDGVTTFTGSAMPRPSGSRCPSPLPPGRG